MMKHNLKKRLENHEPRHRDLLKWIAGIVGAIIATLAAAWIMGVWPYPDQNGNEESTIKVWQEGNLVIPVSLGDGGRAADLDGGRLLPLGTSLSVSGADLIVRQAVHGIVLEPGISKGDGVTFDARFLRVSDTPGSYEVCASATISPSASNHLQLSSSLHVGSYVCMITTQGRLAEFEVVRFDDDRREMTINYSVWQRE